MSLSDFEVLKRLGEGAYSSVYQVKRLADGEIYALKKVKMVKLSDKEKENALNEVRILASIKHPNISSYKEAFIDEPSSSLCIVMEYSDNGDLFQKITQHQQQKQYISEDLIWRIFIQIVKGLAALHDIKIFHRDLKSANIFLSKDGRAKLGDMNVSKVAKKGLLYTQTGTPYYASPEVWRDLPYDHKSDIWSLGCVLYESVTLKPPFRAEDMQGLYKKVLRGIYPKIPNIFSQELAQTIKLLVQVAPHMRPSCDKILDLPIVKKKMEKLFPNEVEYPPQDTNLLSTIRVPKNLLYLTDRLPKPMYDSDDRRRREKDEALRRRTYEGNNSLGHGQSVGHLPDISSNHGSLDPKNRRKEHSLADSQGGSIGATAVGSSQPQLSSNKKKQARRNAGSIKATEAASLAASSVTGSQPIIHQDQREERDKEKQSSVGGSQVREGTRKLNKVESTGSMAADDEVLHKPLKRVSKRRSQEEGVEQKEETRKSSLIRQSQAKKKAERREQARQADDDYDNDEFDAPEPSKMGNEDLEQPQKKKKPAHKMSKRQQQAPTPIAGQIDLAGAAALNSQMIANGSMSPTKNKYGKKNVDNRGLMHNASKDNLAIDPSGSYPDGHERRKPPIQKSRKNHEHVDRGNYQLPDIQSMLPHISSSGDISQGQSGRGGNNRHYGYSNNRQQNMAYVNISSEGNKPVGPIGLKRAEKELIMRRYKNAYHNQNDNINRVALIYGQQHPVYASQDRGGYMSGEPTLVMGNRGAYYLQSNNGQQYGHQYMVAVDSMGNPRNSNNAMNIVRRGKNYLEEIKNQNSGYQVRLPKLANQNRLNNDYYIQQMRRNAGQGLPPVGGQQYGPQISGISGQTYQQYGGYRPSKLRSLNNKHNLGNVGSQGPSAEKVRLGNYNSQDKLGKNYAVSPGDGQYLIQSMPYLEPIQQMQQNPEMVRKSNASTKLHSNGSQVNLKRQVAGQSPADRMSSNQRRAREKAANKNIAPVENPPHRSSPNKNKNTGKQAGIRSNANISNVSTKENSLPPPVQNSSKAKASNIGAGISAD